MKQLHLFPEEEEKYTTSWNVYSRFPGSSVKLLNLLSRQHCWPPKGQASVSVSSNCVKIIQKDGQHLFLPLRKIKQKRPQQTVSRRRIIKEDACSLWPSWDILGQDRYKGLLRRCSTSVLQTLSLQKRVHDPTVPEVPPGLPASSLPFSGQR